MAIINRDQDISEQIVDFNAVISTAVGASAGAGFHVLQMPWPGTLQGVAIAANSVSGAPVVSVDIKRFTATGVTTIAFVGSTLAVLAFGLSAPYTMIPLAGGVSAAGSTLRQLQAGDVVVVNQLFSGGNVAISNAVVTVCVNAVQDIKKHFNIAP